MPCKKIKVINYLSDFGSVNFWSNISKNKIDNDLEFIKECGFNSIIVMLPYASFKPNLSNFETEYTEIFDYLISSCKQKKIYVILRIGYLWEESFQEDRTFERYTKIYKYICKNILIRKLEYKTKEKLLYEDFISFIKHYSSKVDIYHSFLSWEDFFWPIKYATNLNSDDDLDKETNKIIKHIINRINSDKLHVEHRTNAHCNPINTNDSKIHYGYYNTGSICGEWFDLISCKLKQNTIIYKNLTLEKNFLEWLSRIIKTFKLDEPSNKFILNQFNFYDNTLENFKDSSFHNHLLEKQDIERAISFIDFIQPLAKLYFQGIGFWNLWSTISGQIYNGCFIYGLRGWQTSGKLLQTKQAVYLGNNDELLSNLGYIRISDKSEINFCIEYNSDIHCNLLVYLGSSFKKIVVQPQTKRVQYKFNSFEKRQIRIVCKCEQNQGIEITRIDAWKNTHESMIFDYDRKPTELWSKKLKMFIKDF